MSVWDTVIEPSGNGSVWDKVIIRPQEDVWANVHPPFRGDLTSPPPQAASSMGTMGPGAQDGVTPPHRLGAGAGGRLPVPPSLGRPSGRYSEYTGPRIPSKAEERQNIIAYPAKVGLEGIKGITRGTMLAGRAFTGEAAAWANTEITMPGMGLNYPQTRTLIPQSWSAPLLEAADTLKERASRIPKAIPTTKDIHSLGDFGMWAFGSAGEVAPQLGAVLGASAISPIAGPAMVSFMLESGNAYLEGIEMGGAPEKVLPSYAAGIVNSALEMLPAGMALKRLGVFDKVAKQVTKHLRKQGFWKGVTRKLAAISTQAIAEGGTEYPQSWVSTSAAYLMANPEKIGSPEFLREAHASAVQEMYVGGLVGGGVGLGTSMAGPQAPSQTPPAAPGPTNVPQGQLPPTPTQAEATVTAGEVAPVQVVRLQEGGGQPTTDKPQGLFLVPKDNQVLIEGLKGDKTTFDFTPNNPLTVASTLNVRHKERGQGSSFPASSGIKALKALVPEAEFARLLALNRVQLKKELDVSKPDVDWGRFNDAYEMLEGYAGTLAKEAGHDAIIGDPDEVVALADSALTPTQAEATVTAGKGLITDPTTLEKPAGETGGVMMGGRKKGIETPALTIRMTESTDPGMKAFWGRTNKITTAKGKLRHAAAKAKAYFEERFVRRPFMPKTPETAVAHDMMRRTAAIIRAARHSAIVDVGEYVTGKGDRQVIDSAGLNLLRKAAFTEDLLHDAETERGLPEGVTTEALQQELEQWKGLIAQTPSVADAYTMFRDLWAIEQQGLYERGVISKENADNPYYMRHFILDYIDTKGKSGGLKSSYRGYTKRRKGGADPSTDFLEVQIKSLADIRADNAVDDHETAIARANAVAVTNPADAPEGYVPWTYKRNTLPYLADTDHGASVAQNQVAILNDPDIPKSLALPDVVIQEAMDNRHGRTVLYIPEYLANQLDQNTADRNRHRYISALTGPNRLMKRWYIRSNLGRYNLRNFIGDAEKLPASGRERAFLSIPAAIQMMRKPDSIEYQKALEYDVGGQYLLHELGLATELPEFKQFKGDLEKLASGTDITTLKKIARTLAWPVKKAIGVKDTVLKLTQLREDVLRFAVYLDAIQEIQEKQVSGERIRHWAGGKVGEDAVNELAKTDIYAAAAKVSRETLGEYGDFTPWEVDVLQNGLIPFYSWMEINTKFWPRAMAGAIREEGAKAGVRTAKAGAKAVGVRAVTTAVGLSKWAVRISAMYAAGMAWNNHNEEFRKYEQALPAWQRARPHILIPGLDGKPSGLITTPTALSDFLEWFNIDDNIQDLGRFENGQIDGKELFERIAINTSKGPINRVIQAMTPFLKAPYTVATGKTTFPDFFDQKTVAESFSNKAAYRAFLDFVGYDTRSFIEVAEGKRTLKQVLGYYFSGNSWRAESQEELEAKINKWIASISYGGPKRILPIRPATPVAGPHKGKRREYDILQNRRRSLQGVSP